MEREEKLIARSDDHGRDKNSNHPKETIYGCHLNLRFSKVFPVPIESRTVA
jgi:hypothetical protein